MATYTTEVGRRSRSASTTTCADDDNKNDTDTIKDNDVKPPVQNEMLTYLMFYYQRSSADMLTKTVLSFYTAEEIVKAKSTIWHLYADVLPPERRRVTTDKRSADAASLADIINAVGELDSNCKLPCDRFFAVNLDRVPKFAPEEANVMAVMDRVRALELHMTEVQDLAMENRRNIANNAARITETGNKDITTMDPNCIKQNEKTPYSAIVARPANDSKQTTDGSTEPHRSGTTTEAAPVRKVTVAGTQWADDRIRENNRQPRTVAEEGFRFQHQENRRLKRQQTRKTVVGTRVTVGGLRGAQAPGRDIFVYRVEQEADEHEIEEYVKDNGIETRGVALVSHRDATYKSFKITVAVNDIDKVLAANFWPEGIMVRKFRKAKEWESQSG